ncbi:hypothetical protein TREES_T100016951 [Tupaia chinensis]|uniref:Uncharacterized protein n=1 Tax=Tupaia chinensis TaxID=246437 RepID=L9KX16_TUPCH|nr:hypothetical protein TREES_T100016951 [Tupaia chinensis]
MGAPNTKKVRATVVVIQLAPGAGTCDGHRKKALTDYKKMQAFFTEEEYFLEEAESQAVPFPAAGSVRAGEEALRPRPQHAATGFEGMSDQDTPRYLTLILSISLSSFAQRRTLNLKLCIDLLWAFCAISNAGTSSSWSKRCSLALAALIGQPEQFSCLRQLWATKFWPWGDRSGAWYRWGHQITWVPGLLCPEQLMSLSLFPHFSLFHFPLFMSLSLLVCVFVIIFLYFYLCLYPCLFACLCLFHSASLVSLSLALSLFLSLSHAVMALAQCTASLEFKAEGPPSAAALPTHTAPEEEASALWEKWRRYWVTGSITE